MNARPIPTCRVSVDADDPISYAGIAAAVGASRDLTVVDAADDTADPDITLVVTETVDEAAQQRIRHACRTGSRGVVLVLATVDNRGLIAAVESGVSGIVRRADATPDALATAIRTAHRGDGCLPPDLVGRLLEQVTRLHDDLLSSSGRHLDGLSDREIAVLRLVADGRATSEIAVALAYSERTIKNIIQDVTTRLGLRNRSHAVAYAVRQGMI